MGIGTGDVVERCPGSSCADGIGPFFCHQSPCPLPVRLLEGQRLVCRDQATWRVFGADGAELAAGQVAGTFPTLLPGANRVMLASQVQPAADFRVVVKTVKVYR